MRRTVIKMPTATPADRCQPHDLVVASVQRQRADITGQVLRSLRRGGSRLASDPATNDQLRAQVDRVLDDTVAALRRDLNTGDPNPGDPTSGEPTSGEPSSGGPDTSAGLLPDPTGIELGRQRARHGIHPAESMRAETALFRTALAAVAADLRQAPEPVDSLTRFCLALQRSLACRADLVGRSYFTYLLDQIHHAHAQHRLRLSRELHDQVAHTAAVALRDLELYEAYRAADHERAQARLSAAKAHLQEAIDSIRTLASQLRRTETSEGLQPALVRYLSTAAPTVVTSVNVTGADANLPLAVRDELFLVLREALSNALRHADPRTVAVEVRVGNGRVDATVTDDGRGFETEQALAAPSGAGLPSMIERAYAAGGSVQLDSQAGRGTTVTVEIPLPRRPE